MLTGEVGVLARLTTHMESFRNIPGNQVVVGIARVLTSEGSAMSNRQGLSCEHTAHLNTNGEEFDSLTHGHSFLSASIMPLPLNPSAGGSGSTM